MNGPRYITKRNGEKQVIQFDQITERLQFLAEKKKITNNVNIYNIAKQVISGLYDGVTTVELDSLAAEIAASMITKHPDYGILASAIAVSNLHKETNSHFSGAMQQLYDSGKITSRMYEIVNRHRNRLDNAINDDQDYSYTYFGYKTMERSYLKKIDDKVIERPQYMLMRVAVAIHEDDIDSVIETYQLLSEKWFTHATPTLCNAGSSKGQMSSCFLLSLDDTNYDGVFSTLKKCALISECGGGIGLNVHDIEGTNKVANGLIPMLRVFNNTARYVDQGVNKRPGAMAVYLEPWHSDIYDFLKLKLNIGPEEIRARDLFYGLWIPDLFMKRVEENKEWTLMCPQKCPGLSDCWGAEFEDLYTKYERDGKGVETVKAQDLWHAIIKAQIETGVPYMLYKDSCNSKSNQQNLGTIKCSNLCSKYCFYIYIFQKLFTSPFFFLFCYVFLIGCFIF